MSSDRHLIDFHAVIVESKLRSHAIDRKVITLVANRLRRSLGLDGYQLSITLVGSRAIKTLNREYRGFDKATDVLSFPQIDWHKPVPVASDPSKGRRSLKFGATTMFAPVLGDIVISLPEAAANARAIGQTLDREVCFLIVHGFLHLCGYDHMVPKDERLMLRAQKILMRALGDESRKPVWTGCVKAKAKRRKRAK